MFAKRFWAMGARVARHLHPLVKGAAVALIFWGTSAHAGVISFPEIGPAPFNSGSWATNSMPGMPEDNPLNSLSSNDQSGERVAAYGSAAYRTNLAEGAVGVAASTAVDAAGFPVALAQAAIFDTLIFDFGGAEFANVSFSLAIEGTLLNLSDTRATAIGGGSISIVDVTGLENSFFVSGRVGQSGNLTQNGAEVFEFPSEFGDFIFVNPERIVNLSSGHAVITPDLEASVNSGSYSIGVADDFTVSTDGQPISFTRELSGNFLATAGNSYALLINSIASVSNQNPAGITSADLLGTSTFAFTDLSGGSFLSASGVFPGGSGAIPLDDTIAPVPTPATLPLIAIGFLGLAWLRHRRQTRV